MARKTKAEYERINKLGDRIERKYDGLLLTTENLTKESIKAGLWRIADFSGECATGITYYVGTLDQCENWVNNN